MTKLRRRNIAAAEQRHYQYGSSTDLADLDWFYHQLYLPYAHARFGRRAITYSLESQRAVLTKRGVLLTVRARDSMLAAYLGMFRAIGKTFSALHLGVDDERADGTDKLVLVALYWHLIRWAHERGLRTVDFGRTRGRLSDGVFRFKYGWGMRFAGDPIFPSMWTFLLQAIPPGLARRLNELGFIVESATGPHWMAIEDEAARLAGPDSAVWSKIAAQAGLGGKLVVSQVTRYAAPGS